MAGLLQHRWMRGNHVNDITFDSLYSTMYWFVSHPADVARMSKNARPMICERYEQKDVWEGSSGYI